MVSILDNLEEFEWDQGNKFKSLSKHGVTPLEAEEVFFNFNLLSSDPGHSLKESRYRLLGQSSAGRILFVIFTIRSNRIRIISSRLASKQERSIYEKAFKENS
jgi:uncharacterized DUF497 family protein